ncbi:MAG: ABZJ_00895 family protein [Roseobacter sp.]|jgi:hypothetical protein
MISPKGCVYETLQFMGVAMYCRKLRFIGNFSMSFLGVAFLTSLVDFLPGLQSSMAAMLSLPLLIAAMIEGQYFAYATRSRPSVRTSFAIAAAMTGLIGAVTIATLLLFSLWQGQNAWPDANWLIVTPAAFLLLLIGYAIGLASELKGQQVSALRTV